MGSPTRRPHKPQPTCSRVPGELRRRRRRCSPGWERTSVRGEADEVVAARRALLDALEALEMHRDAVVLVGAQAIYVRLGEADVAVSPFTVDGDLAIDPDVLADTPPIAEAMMAANFHLREADEGGEEP